MDVPSQQPIGAATAAVEAARRQVNVADRHLADALNHLAAAAEVLDSLTSRRQSQDAATPGGAP